MNYRRIAPGFYLGNPVFAIANEKEITLYSKQEFEKVAEEYEKLNMFHEDSRKIKQMFFRHIFKLHYDNYGRITLNRHLRRVSGISIGDKVTIEELSPEILRIALPGLSKPK